MNNDFIIVYVTTANKKQAEKIASTLVEEKLISCAHIFGPVSSFFNWQGKLECTEEFRIVMKSRVDLFDELSKRVKAFHSYEVPEIIAVPIVAGSKAYLDWMQSVLKQP